MTMRPLLNGEAVFSDESPAFRVPFEPEADGEVTVRLRTEEAGADAVYLVSRFQRVLMTLKETVNGFDYYEVTIRLGTERLFYHFEIEIGRYVVCYNKGGLSDVLIPDSEFLIIPGFKVPEWTRGAVMYQIFTDRFCNGDPSNDVLEGEYRYLEAPAYPVGWDDPLEPMDVGRFYGGDLRGVISKLDYLKELGVEAIYFNPLFVSPSNHKYDTQDYGHIDPHFGAIVKDEGALLDETAEGQTACSERYRVRTTDEANLRASDELFADLVREAHGRGIRVILDGVFNHCGSFNRWLDREKLYVPESRPDDDRPLDGTGAQGEASDDSSARGGIEAGAYISPDSRYRSYFRFKEDSWPDNASYEGWWDHETLPKLNYDESRLLIGEIMDIAVKWLKPPYNADGWRLDVAADLGHTPGFNHAFWQLFRKTVREAAPETFILAEHYGDASDHLQGDEWDTVMNYDAFMEPVTYFLTGMEKHSDSYHPALKGDGRLFFNTMRDRSRAFSGPSLMSAMNELDNHDHSRFLTRTNHKVGRLGELGREAASQGVSPAVMRLGVVMQMTWVGAPTIYYGDEAGVPGFTDPDSRRTYPWGRENEELLAFYKRLTRVRSDWPVFREGSLIELFADGPVIAYGRFDDESQAVVIVNAGDEPKDVRIPVWLLGLDRDETAEFRQIFGTSDEDELTIRCKDGMMELKTAPEEARIFGRK